MTQSDFGEYFALKSEVLQIIDSIEVEYCVTFGARCCESLLPNYEAFSVLHNWGNPSLLREALELIWNGLTEKRKSDDDQVSRFLKLMDTIAPDPQIYRSVFVWPALCAVDATVDLLSYSASNEKHHIKNIVALTLYAIDQYVREVAFPMDTFSIPPDKSKALYTWVAQAPILIQELHEQQQVLETLRQSPTLTPDFLDDLRRKAQKSGINPIRRGLVVVPKDEV